MIESMKFENYILDNLSYTKNEEFESNDNEKINGELNFKSTVYYSSTAPEGIVTINVVVGNLKDSNSAFQLEIQISGLFSFKSDDKKLGKQDIDEMKKMLALNGNAILYPYLRAMVSDITMRSNQFPTYILPTINFIKLLEKNKSITFEEMVD